MRKVLREDLGKYFDRAERAWAGRTEKLMSSSVAVIGAGAVGSLIAERFYRAGVGRLLLVDGDVVEAHNLERVSCYTEADVGRNKAIALAECLGRIRPGLPGEVEAIPKFVDKYFPFERLREVNLVITAIDDVYTRVVIGDFLAYYNIPHIDVTFGEELGRVLYFPSPREGPCIRDALSKEEIARAFEVLGYNLLATCPRCLRRFKITDWKWPHLIKVRDNDGNPIGNAKPIFEGDKVVAIGVVCPYCGEEFRINTPEAPAPTLSEVSTATAIHAFGVAVRHLLGVKYEWNMLLVALDKLVSYKISAADHANHVVALNPAF